MGGKDRAPICTWHVNLRDRDTRAERHMIFMTERERERENLNLKTQFYYNSIKNMIIQKSACSLFFNSQQTVKN